MVQLQFLIGLLGLIAPAMAAYGLQLGGEDKSRRWPKNRNGISSVGYCFEDETAQNDLGNYISKTWVDVWQKKLGTAGAQNGHRLELIRLFQDGGDWPYCYLQNGQWNDAFPGDALVVRRGPDNHGRGSLGYYKDGEKGRHILQQGLGNEDFQILWSMAHELGHVFGLLHEHSRPDRDNYVQLNCINLAGFEEALKRAYADGYNKQDLCTRDDVADQYGFPSLEYMSDPQGWRSPEYDHDSIMHYPSQAHADVDLVIIDPNNPDFYPLVRLSGAEREKKIIFPPEEGFEISAGDVGAIRDMYPW